MELQGYNVAGLQCYRVEGFEEFEMFEEFEESEEFEMFEAFTD